MTNITGLTIEALVSILLLLTILYCARLNRQLKGLKANDASMKQTIAELMTATESAERAIAGLKLTVREAENTLGEQLRDAENFSASIVDTMQAGEDLLHRLRKLAHAQRLFADADKPDEAPRTVAGGAGARPVRTARPAETERPDMQAMAAAARAISERARSRNGGLAA
jgi:hypothetical protein